ncbi:class I SAM-dependent methyltransferase [Accumulibacter sp.]|uniref:class I SAM-dependent methyltransferase n=1 Tax=Accumulibacter sp. TaxID=2053492 RepID=UPI002B9A4425|nr:class I SAM-dependent methyltransferase [Accumulibacter sp.]HNC19627.1 class I SAM-dependent methyltransferase [Accumulibacter sp.]
MSALQRLGFDPIAAVSSVSVAQRQTDEAFGFKWAKRDTYESEAAKANMRRWLIERYCDNDPARLSQWLAGGRKIILDAGCGAGFSGLLFFGDALREHDYLGVDISSSVDVARDRFKEIHMPGDFVRADISRLDIPDSSVDIIFSEGVLDHTDSTEGALKHLARKLVPGGRFLFYVYRKKARIREFTDDAIREALQPLTDEEAWEALKPLTRLGIVLGELGRDIELPDPIPFLGIEAGKLDLQRFFYWNICKAYYRPELTFEEMHHINFDWFRPLNCQRHTPEEIAVWCTDAELDIEHMNIQEAGITVVARRK